MQFLPGVSVDILFFFETLSFEEEVITMNFKRCFTSHALSHSLFGLGLGLAVANLVPSLDNLLYGVVVMVVAIVWDAMAKS